MPLTLVVRDVLGFAKTRKEAKVIVSQDKMKVDGRIQREELSPIGLMDVISIPDIKKDFRILPSETGLTLHPVEKTEAEFKLCRIENKTTLKGGHIQLNLHDGTNLLISVKNPKNPEEDVYKTLDVLRLALPDREVLDHVALSRGAAAMIIGGKNVGKHGKITAIEERPGQKRREFLATLEDKTGNIFQTVLDYVFVLGDVEPHISLPEVN